MSRNKGRRWSSEERELAESYSDTLSDLNENSRPHIINLTELANDNKRKYPHVVVHCIEERLSKASDKAKLPTLYLLDSIIKNHPEPYKKLFTNNLPTSFTTVFRRGDEKVRSSLFKLRNTWTPLFPAAVLYKVDVAVKAIDANWPIMATKPAEKSGGGSNIHLNPAFIKQASVDNPEEAEIKRMERELMELKKKKLQLQLEATKKEVEQVEKKLDPPALKTGGAASNSSKTKSGESSSKATSSSSRKIIVDQKKIRDPRMKGKLPQELVEMLDMDKKTKIETLSPNKAAVNDRKEYDKRRSKSRSPSRAKSKSPNRSKSRSPGHQSPTSTSDDTRRTPPPPPSIRHDMRDKPKAKSSSPENKKKSKKSSSSEAKKRPSAAIESEMARLHNEEDNDSSPSPPPTKKSFKIPKRAKRASGDRDRDKAKRLNEELFGADESWSKFKEAHPDEYRTPLVDQGHPRSQQQHQQQNYRGGGGGYHYGNQRGFGGGPRGRRQGHPGGGQQPRPQPWEQGGPMMGPQFGGRPEPFGPGAAMPGNMEQMRDADPHVILNHVIPLIEQEGLQKLHNRYISPEQYSQLKHHMQVLKEHAIMTIENMGPGGGVNAPGGRGMEPDYNKENGAAMQQQQQNINMNMIRPPFPGNHQEEPMYSMNNMQGQPGPWQQQPDQRPNFDQPQQTPFQRPHLPPFQQQQEEPLQEQLSVETNNDMVVPQSPEVDKKAAAPAMASPAAGSELDYGALWSNLVKAGLVNNESKTSGAIPGLEESSDAATVAKATNNEEAEASEIKQETVANDPEAGKEFFKPDEKKIVHLDERFDMFKDTKRKESVRSVVLRTGHETLKKRQDGLVEAIYDPSALQCKSCGLRFKVMQTVAYNNHLDWHFRLRRREKENVNKAQTRKWYLEWSDWRFSDEIDEAVDGTEVENDNNEDTESEIPSVPAKANKEDNTCPVCQEEFEQMFKEEVSLNTSHDLEESDAGQWHLMNAVRPDGPDGQAYHPQCYTDKDNVANEAIMEEVEQTDEEMPEVKTEDSEITEPEVKSELPDASEIMASIENENVEDDGGSEEAELKLEAEDVKAEPEVAADDNGDHVKTKEEGEEQDETMETEDVAEADETELGNLTADAGVIEPPSFPSMLGIKINMKSQSAPVSPKDGEAVGSEVKTEGEVIDNPEKKEIEEEESEFDADAIIQKAPGDPFEHKPKLKDRKFQEWPMKHSSDELSGLCSIM